MKIRSKFRIGAAFTVTALLVAGGVLTYAVRRVKRMQAQAVLIDQSISMAFDLALLAQDLEHSPFSRVRRQWGIAHTDLTEQIQKLVSAQDPDLTLLAALVEHNTQVNAAFDELAALREELAAGRFPEKEGEHLAHHLMHDLNIELRGLVSVSCQLLYSHYQQISLEMRRVVTASLFSALLIAAAVIALVSLVGRSLLAPLAQLQAHMARVAQGDFTFSPTPTGDDEVGALFQSFAQMSTDLGQTTASRNELRTEVLERKRAEEELRQLSRTRAALLQEVNHRVKNNLLSIIGLLEMEEDRAQSRCQPDCLQVLREITGRIRGLAMVHGLLSSSQWAPLELGELCKQIVTGAVSGRSYSKKIHVEVLPSNGFICSSQAHQLALVLNELATNSIKHAFHDRDDCRIRIRASETEGNLRIRYSDNGPGFPPDILDGSTGTPGLGCEIVRGIVTYSLAGTIRLENNNGSVTTIEFPCETAAKDSIDDAPETQSTVGGAIWQECDDEETVKP